MAQPLEKHSVRTPSGIDQVATRLEQALLRLEAASRHVAASHHSLKADREKLNHLLREAEEKIVALKEGGENGFQAP